MGKNQSVRPRWLRAVAKQERQIQSQRIDELFVFWHIVRTALPQSRLRLLDELRDVFLPLQVHAEGNHHVVARMGKHGSKEHVFLSGEDGCCACKRCGKERLGRTLCRTAHIRQPLLVNGHGSGQALSLASFPAVWLWFAFRFAVGEMLGPERRDCPVRFSGILGSRANAALGVLCRVVLVCVAAHTLPPQRDPSLLLSLALRFFKHTASHAGNQLIFAVIFVYAGATTMSRSMKNKTRVVTGPHPLLFGTDAC